MQFSEKFDEVKTLKASDVTSKGSGSSSNASSPSPRSNNALQLNVLTLSFLCVCVYVKLQLQTHFFLQFRTPCGSTPRFTGRVS